MNRTILTVIAFIILVGGGIGLIVTSNETSTDTDTATSEQQAVDDSDNNSEGKEFIAVNSFDQSFVATISGESDGVAFTGTLESDGAGLGKFSSEQEGRMTEFYFTPDEFITCTDNSCFRTPNNGPTPFDTSQYTYSDTEFEKFKETATYKGTQDCLAGTCDVWLVNDDTNNVTSELFISTANQRISKVVGTENGNTTTIEYEFKNVTITLPENIQDIPSINQ